MRHLDPSGICFPNKAQLEGHVGVVQNPRQTTGCSCAPLADTVDNLTAVRAAFPSSVLNHAHLLGPLGAVKIKGGPREAVWRFLLRQLEALPATTSLLLGIYLSRSVAFRTSCVVLGTTCEVPQFCAASGT